MANRNLGTVRGDVEKLLIKLVRITRNHERNMDRRRESHYRSTIRDIKSKIVEAVG